MRRFYARSPWLLGFYARSEHQGRKLVSEALAEGEDLGTNRL